MNTEIEYIQVSSTKMEHLLVKVCAAVLQGFKPRGMMNTKLEFKEDEVITSTYSQSLRKVTKLPVSDGSFT
jgi:hypothetical protein